MRRSIVIASLLLSACAGSAPARPVPCGGPVLLRAEVIGFLKQQLRIFGIGAGVVDDPRTTIQVVDAGCDYQVRMQPAPVKVGGWTVFTMSRDGLVTEVSDDLLD